MVIAEGRRMTSEGGCKLGRPGTGWRQVLTPHWHRQLLVLSTK